MDTCVYASWKWATNRRMKKKTEKEGEFGLKLRKEMWRVMNWQWDWDFKLWWLGDVVYA